VSGHRPVVIVRERFAVSLTDPRAYKQIITSTVSAPPLERGT
jgi:hypothetical protein